MDLDVGWAQIWAQSETEVEGQKTRYHIRFQVSVYDRSQILNIPHDTALEGEAADHEEAIRSRA
jgi:hypothetical protein